MTIFIHLILSANSCYGDIPKVFVIGVAKEREEINLAGLVACVGGDTITEEMQEV